VNDPDGDSVPTPLLPGAAFDAFKTFVAQFDPLELLSQLTLTWLFTQKDFVSESDVETRYARFVEFTAGYLASQPIQLQPTQTFDGSCIEEFEKLVTQYFDSFLVELVYGDIDARERTPAASVLRSAQIYSLWVRGDAYPHQFFGFASELYSPHDQWFQSKLGFTIKDALQIVRAIREELNRRVNESADNARQNAPIEAEKYWAEAQMAQITRDELEQRVAIHLHYGAAKSLLCFSVEEICEVSGVELETCKAFLKRMSQPFGYHNPKFPNSFTDAKKAPWDYNTVEERPFLQHGDCYWFFTNPMIASVLFYTFFFDLMDDKQYKPAFEKTRGDFVERKVFEYVSRIFPQDMIFLNPEYPDGNEFSDVVVLHDGKILIFQCKAKGLTRNARVGGDFLQLRTDMQAAIRDAFNQAVRARQYIRNSENPALNVKGMRLTIDGTFITDIYLITVTLMPLLMFVTRFENIEDALGLFPDKEYPFSLALGDLDILTQIVKSPAMFLQYVNRRLTIEKTSFGVHADEIDLLGFYLHQGMYFDESEFGKYNEVSLSGFSDQIDEFVHRKYDLGEAVEPPAPPLPGGFSELLENIESLSSMYRTDCAIALLDMSGPGRAKIVEVLENTRTVARSNRKGGSLSMGASDLSRGFSFMVATGERTTEAIYEQAYCFAMLKKYSEKCDEWFGLGWHIDSDRIVDVALSLKFPWEFDPTMERLVAEGLKVGKRIVLRPQSNE
jgi:hypothetical protein